MNNLSLVPPFWPSGRLWLKFSIGLVYVPFLFLLLFWLFYRGIFLRGLYLVSFFLLFVGGPISIGLFLSPGWRGIRAGLVTVIAIPMIWFIAGFATQDVGSIDIDLQLGLVAAGVVILLEIITGDVGSQTEMVGLGIGLAVGLLLIFVNSSLVGPFSYTGNDELLSFHLYLLNALVWLNALFFPEWVSGKVGWGGVLVWIVLISIVFGLSFMLLQ